MEEAEADWRRGQTCPCCGPAFDAVLATLCLEASAMQPQIWQILPSTLTEPACLAAPAYPAPGFRRGAQRRETPPWVELSIPEIPFHTLFVPQTLGMASSLQVQGVERQCRNHFPASQPPLAWAASWLCRARWLTCYLAPWVLISSLILSRWVSLDTSLPFCLALPLCRVVNQTGLSRRALWR